MKRQSAILSANAVELSRKKAAKLIVGLMSGTSTDGIDAVLLRVKGSGLSTTFKQIGFSTFPFSPSLKKRLLTVQDIPLVSLEEISRLHFIMGEVFASAALKLCGKYSVSPERVDIIASHGHTVAHFPASKKIAGHSSGATMQIGDPSVIAQRTGITTVGDFRAADIAAGGEGAPLVPYFDYLALRSSKESRGLLNIGGIGNLTVIPKACTPDDVHAFDTGPGNMVIDYVMHVLFNKRMDKNGRIAASGKISKPLLRWLMIHPFLKKNPPRSTGREEFGPAFGEKVIKKAKALKLPLRDSISTVSSFTAEAIAQSYRKFIERKTPLRRIITAGGGLHNAFIMDELSRLLPGIKIESITGYGITPDAKEAVAFAILANETIHGHPSNLRNATGARKNAVLGKICLL